MTRTASNFKQSCLWYIAAHADVRAQRTILQVHSASSTMTSVLLLAALGYSVCCAHSQAHAHAPPSVEVVIGSSGSDYTVLVGGEVWLHSGTLRFYVNGEWHGRSIKN